MPSAWVNSMPPIGVIMKSTKGFIGPTMPSSFSVIGKSTSLTSEPTSRRSWYRLTLGAAIFWPYCQSQSTSRLALSLGMPLASGMSSTVSRLMSVLTLKIKPKLWLADCEISLLTARRPRLSPLISMPSTTSVPLAWKPSWVG